MNKLLSILQTSIKAKVIASVLGVTVLTGGSMGGYAIYKNHRETNKPVTVADVVYDSQQKSNQATTGETVQVAQATTQATSNVVTKETANQPTGTNPANQQTSAARTSTPVKTSTPTKASTPTSSPAPSTTPSPSPNDPRYAAITQYNRLTYGYIAIATQFAPKGTYLHIDGVAIGSVFGSGIGQGGIDIEVDIKSHTLTAFIGADIERQYAGDDLFLSLVNSNGQTIFNGPICKVTSSTDVVTKVIDMPTYSAGSAGTWLSPATYTIRAWTQHEELNKGTFPVDERGLGRDSRH